MLITEARIWNILISFCLFRMNCRHCDGGTYSDPIHGSIYALHTCLRSPVLANQMSQISYHVTSDRTQETAKRGSWPVSLFSATQTDRQIDRQKNS